MHPDSCSHSNRCLWLRLMIKARGEPFAGCSWIAFVWRTVVQVRNAGLECCANRVVKPKRIVQQGVGEFGQRISTGEHNRSRQQPVCSLRHAKQRILSLIEIVHNPLTRTRYGKTQKKRICCHDLTKNVAMQTITIDKYRSYKAQASTWEAGILPLNYGR